MESGLDTQAVDNFLKLARGAQTKEDYLSRVREFDRKFVDAYPSPIVNPLPNIPNIPKSNMPQNINNLKQPINEPPKNPFISPAEQKFRFTTSQMTINQTQFKVQQPPSGRRSNPIANIPHSRSQTNFYKQPQLEQLSYENVNATMGNFYDEQQIYRQNMLDRSYSNVGQQIDPRYANHYQAPQQAYNTQPYIQQNQFLQSYEVQQPNYVKFYKKQIPQPNPKASFAQNSRVNPFKQ